MNLSSCDNYNLMDNNFLNYYFDCNVIYIKELLILILLIIITLYPSIILSVIAKYQTLTIVIILIGGDHQIDLKFINTNKYTNNYDVKICLLITYIALPFMSLINSIVGTVVAAFILYLILSMFLTYFLQFNLF